MYGFQKKERYMHYVMCFNGGFLGGYSLLCRGNFGSGQTSNMIQIILDLLGKNLKEFSLRLLGLFIYCLGIIICTFLSSQKRVYVQRYAIMVNFLGLLFLSILPHEVNPLMAIIPVFFMVATQWSVFHGIEKYNCSTIFSTNNIRQCISSLVDYLIYKKDFQKKKTLFYAQTLFWYHFGTLISFFSCNKFDIQASLICIPFMIFAWILTLKNNPFKSNEYNKKWRYIYEKSSNDICR